MSDRQSIFHLNYSNLIRHQLPTTVYYTATSTHLMSSRERDSQRQFSDYQKQFHEPQVLSDYWNFPQHT